MGMDVTFALFSSDSAGGLFMDHHEKWLKHDILILLHQFSYNNTVFHMFIFFLAVYICFQARNINRMDVNIHQFMSAKIEKDV